MSLLQSTSLFIRLGFRNALKYRRRSIEVGGVVFISALVMTALGGFITGFIDNYMNQLLENTAHARIFHTGYYQKQEITPLELSIGRYRQVVDEIRAADETVLVSPTISAGAVVSLGDNSLNMLCQGIQPYAGTSGTVFPSYRSFSTSVIAGHFFSNNAEQGILVSSYVIANLGCRIGDRLIVFTSDAYGSFNAVELPILGVFRTGYKEKDEGVCLVDLASMQQLVGLEDGVTELGLVFRDLAEADTLLLHGITMTGADQMVLWRPETVKVILEVQALRHEGVRCYFSIDTGATVYINTSRENLATVRKRIEGLGISTLTCSIGGEARLIEEHLF
jgi:ABC-type lipoprotein release transport system permease subunit